MCPAPVWDQLARGPFDEDAKALGPWLQEALTRFPPSRPLTGLWFGLATPVDEAGAPQHAMYLAGTSEPDVSMEDHQWIYALDWRPDIRPAPLLELRRFPTGFEDPPREGEPEAAWALPLAYAASAVVQTLRNLPPGPWAAPATVTAVGYDSGDILVLGTLSRVGFRLNDRLDAF
jgi:hypothetical protein